MVVIVAIVGGVVGFAFGFIAPEFYRHHRNQRQRRKAK